MITEVLGEVYKDNSAAFSPTVPFNTTTPAPAPVPVTLVWQNVPYFITEANTDQVFELNFGENVPGLTLADIDQFGLENRQLTLYRVFNNEKTEHTDDTPASLFRVKMRINANQQGTVWLSLKPNSVTSVDDSAVGPVVSVTSLGVRYDTNPVEPETEDASVYIGYPEISGKLAEVLLTETVDFDITWSEGFERFNSGSVRIYESINEENTPDVRFPSSGELTDVGTPGTHTHWQLSYTPPANSQGRVVVEIPAGTFKNNEKVSSHSAVFDTRPAATPTPEIQSMGMPEGIQTAPFDAVVTFDRAVTGVDADAFALDALTGTAIVFGDSDRNDECLYR